MKRVQFGTKQHGGREQSSKSQVRSWYGTLSTARRPDLTLEDAKECTIWIVDMACPAEANIAEKRREKLQKYQQLVFEIPKRRVGFIVEIVPW